MGNPSPGRNCVALIALGLLLCVVACSSVPQPGERGDLATGIARAAHWTPLRIQAGTFVLYSFVSPERPENGLLTVYIEGDGLAWIDRFTPSTDPTPIDPIGLKLAVRHRMGAAAYLARPCQFTSGSDRSACTTAVWTGARFAEDVITATGIALDTLKRERGAQRITLVGYSGGGAVAALVASRRNDVDLLVTIAGNLDHETWTRVQGLAPLSESLNAANAWAQLSGLPQVHFVGSADTVVDARVTAGYIRRFAGPAPRVITIDGFDHSCCWVRAWGELQSAAFEMAH